MRSLRQFNRRVRVGLSSGSGVALWTLIVAVIMVTATAPSAIGSGADERGAGAAPARVKTLEVVVLSTMLADRAGVGEWGFSALVETGGHRILFDTGARPETVLQNARELKIDLSDVTEVILSHHHGDHVGGLLTLRRELAKQNPDALKKAYVGAGIFLSRPGPRVRKPMKHFCSRSRMRSWEARSS